MAELITENEQVTAEKETQGVADQGSEATAKMVNRLMQRSNLASKGLRGEWPLNYRFVVSGEQWSIQRPRWRFSEVVNVTWSNIMTEVGIQTDQKPQVDYNAVEPSDFQFAEVLKEVNDVNWEKPLTTGHGWQQKTRTGVFKSKLYHVVHAEVGWDPALEDGLGDIDYKILDPYGCFWDPLASSTDEARYFIYAVPVPTAQLKKEYPDQADKIKPDVSVGDRQQDPGADPDTDRFFLFTETTKKGGSRSDRDDDRYGGEEMTLKLRCWIKDETIETLKEEKEGEIEFVKKKKFPKGRYIEVANNVTLLDKENEFDDGRFPIARLVNYDYGEYAGENEVTHQRGPQKVLNYVWSFLLDQMKMAGNAQWIVSGAAKKIAKKLTNEPGLVVEVPTQGDIRKEPGTGIPAGMFQLADLATSLLDKVSGLQDVTRGAPQPGVTSGLMLEGFVEAAQTRPRLKNRSLDDFLTEVGYLMASRYLQFYKAPRMFRITNKEGVPEFVEFFIQDGPEGRQSVTRKFDQDGVPPKNEEGIPFEPQVTDVKGMPDVRASSGSSLPFARAQKTATALDLQGRGSITNLAMLKAINWPSPEEEDEKVKKEQEALAAQQAPPGAA